IYEQMVGSITVIMDASGARETTIDLTDEAYKSSPFYGTKISISEYSTAPLHFNIEISTTSQGQTILAPQLNNLMAAFQTGGYNFTVERCEVRLLKDEERFHFKRKGSLGGDAGAGS